MGTSVHIPTIVGTASCVTLGNVSVVTSVLTTAALEDVHSAYIQDITAREKYEQSTVACMCENVTTNHIKSHYFVHLKED